MAYRVLCEMKTCEWTGIEYPVIYNGNCFITSDSKALQDFKKEVLAKYPELKGKLKIMTLKTQQEKEQAARYAREHNRAYQEWNAYQSSKW